MGMGSTPFPIPGEPVADTSTDGVGTCIHIAGIPSPMGDVSGVSPGCCTAVTFLYSQAHQHPLAPSDYMSLIGKCGKKDQDSLLAWAEKLGHPASQNLVEQISNLQVVAIDMVSTMINSASDQGATNSYQLGVIAMFGGIGGVVGALFALALVKRYSPERTENEHLVLA